MGLSRNKVAVSEGAAGSPPFYGDSSRGTEEPSSWKKPSVSESLWRIKIEKKRIRYSQRIVQKKEFRKSKSWNSLFDFQSPAKKN